MLALVLATACSSRSPAGPAADPCDSGSGGVTEHSAGQMRYLLAEPARRRGPLPVVLILHGSGSSPEEALQPMAAAADEQGVVVVAPEGTGSPRGWVTFTGSGTGLIRTEEARLSVVLDAVAAQVCVDAARVSAVGFSNGAAMAALLGCVEPRRVHAVVMVAGTVWPGSPCTPAAPVPVLGVQGADDQVFASFHDRTPPGCCGGIVVWPPAEAVQRWAEHNGCAAPQPIPAPEGMVVQEARGCADGAAVELVTLARTGHAWPRGPLPDGRTLAQHVLGFLAASA